ncbi:MAG TPA: hypothetical protein VMV31_01930 [Terriglobales bacterium]|nr:hypothetical protein [Terriglobales bacterium]
MSPKDGTYESRLEKLLQKAPLSNATLVLADQDLSKSGGSFAGLSVNAVAAASTRLSIPLCSYSRQSTASDYEWRRRWEEAYITLKFQPGRLAELARRALIIARGFATIRAALEKAPADKTPSRLLATILGRPDSADKLAQYGMGDQSRLTIVPKEGNWDNRRASLFLGYWLWNSILRYPGLLANEVAAASHLNLGIKVFKGPQVQALFQKAVYRGPFADRQDPRWWRTALDEILGAADVADGLELVRARVDKRAKRSSCSVEPADSAGYYCPILEHPVSLKSSRGSLPWFPRGADLTRVCSTCLDSYGPWLGV